MVISKNSVGLVNSQNKLTELWQTVSLLERDNRRGNSGVQADAIPGRQNKTRGLQIPDQRKTPELFK
jgi:hypothetical protein